MTPDDSIQTATPAEHAEELAGLIENYGGTNSVSYSADDDGAIVMCYVFVDHTDEIVTLAENADFDVVHSHQSGDEYHYVFGYRTETESTSS